MATRTKTSSKTKVTKAPRKRKAPTKTATKAKGGVSLKLEESDDINEIEIPSGPSEGANCLEDHVISIYGVPGVGKTTLAAQFDGCVIAQFEPKRKGLKIRKQEMHYIPITEYDNTKRRPIIQSKNFLQKALYDDTVKTVAIDTSDLMFKSAEHHVCYEKGLSSPGEANDYGITWDEVSTMVRTFLNIFLEADKGIIFVDHSTVEKIELATGDIEKIQPMMRSSKTGLLPIISQMTDIIIYYGEEINGDRTMLIYGSDNIVAKSSVDDHFMTPDGEPLKKFLAGESCEEAYAALVSAYNNELYNYEVQEKPKTSRRKKKTSTK